MCTEGKMKILITGGTGSLGNELVRQLLNSHYHNSHTFPYIEKIIIYSRDEHKQEALQKKFEAHVNYPKLRFFIGDIRDENRLELATRECTHIIHAAALKIVPALEYNPFEAVKTNILGTQNVIECALRNKLNKVVFISTDKAVMPINLYGATKLAAEKMIHAANNIMGTMGPQFITCRYGNVANSNGSVIPLFMRQLKDGKPLTVTHREMTRFYITLENAAKFVLDKLFEEKSYALNIPDMKAFRVLDLVRALKGQDYTPYFIGVRPGEKIHEVVDNIEIDGDIVYRSSDKATMMDVDEIKAELRQMVYI